MNQGCTPNSAAQAARVLRNPPQLLLLLLLMCETHDGRRYIYADLTLRPCTPTALCSCHSYCRRFTDRMDCQLVMGAFAYIYCSYFLALGQGPGGSDVVSHYLHVLIARLSEADLRSLHAKLGEHLASSAAAAVQGVAAAAAAGQ